jgi:hypothetical protein
MGTVCGREHSSGLVLVRECECECECVAVIYSDLSILICLVLRVLKFIC